jgi:hypothetical protein
MTPAAFIAKWRANARNERAAAQEHFLDLCALLDEPTPNSDPTGASYAFEKGATKASGGEGWADVWRRGRFAWEYKGKHKDLDAAHRQLLQYAGALENPPLCEIACNTDPLRAVFASNLDPSALCVSIPPFGRVRPGRGLGDDVCGCDRRHTARLFRASLAD